MATYFHALTTGVKWRKRKSCCWRENTLGLVVLLSCLKLLIG
jgi:hypothetical protein